MLEMHELAQLGAKMRLEQLTEEMNALEAFLEDQAPVPPQNGSPFTPQQRQAISERMKAYWARRRAANGQR